VTEEVMRGILLVDLDFLRINVKRVVQQLLEVQVSAHIGAAPY
jgi:hypothetical protein